MAIQSFKCKDTEAFFQGRKVPKFSQFEDVAVRKLKMLKAAVQLQDLKAPPGNKLEALQGDRAGQHSIRINKQWRICFVWTCNGPADVEIVDYH